uniref:Ig-like domain-containing protein n=1 Tax=Labrus bergylta TaxID=56723 RepID=A0A3Q3ELP0_9LABR
MFYFSVCKGEDRVIQPTEDVFASEGDTITLGCTFETTNPYPNLFWYRQEMGSSPQLLIGGYSEKKEKLSTRHDKQSKEFHLEISSAALTDSAVYYCALQPTFRSSTVTLSYIYSDLSTGDYFFWYRQNVWREDKTILQHPLEGFTH